MLLIRGRWVISGSSISDPVLSDAAVAVDDDRIQELGDWSGLRTRYPEADVIGSAQSAVIPGLINAHHHSAGVTHQQQGVADDLLESWLLSLRRQRRADPYPGTLLSNARLLASGVTSVVEVHSGRGNADDYSDSLRRSLKAYDDSGMRVVFASGIGTESHLIAGEDAAFLASLPDEVRSDAEQWLPGPDAVDENSYFAIVDECYRHYRQHPRIDVWFAPPGPQWVSDRFMQRIAEQAAAYDCGVQTHVTESFYEKLHGLRSHGRPIVQHLHELGVLSPRFSIAHGVWLSEKEIDILAETGAAISHNPSSNLRLRAGIAPLNALLAAGVTTALGMDGTTLNDDDDMFTEMRLALRLHRTPRLHTPAPAPCDVFRMATAGGAELLRKDRELGRLAPGYLADIIVLDTERLSWPWIAPECDPRELLLMRAKADDVRTVLVGGEVVWNDGRPTRFDIDAAARELAGALKTTPFPQRQAELIERLRPYIEGYYGAWEAAPLTPYISYNSKDE